MPTPPVVPLAVPQPAELDMAQSATQHPYKPARLRKPDKDSQDQRWMIIWWQWSLKEEKMIRRRQGFDLATYDSKREREKRAADLVSTINKALKKGFVYDPDKELQKARPTRKSELTSLSKLLFAYDVFYKRQQAAGRAKATLDGYVNLRVFLFQWLDEEAQDLDMRLNQFTADRAEDYCTWQAERPSRRDASCCISSKTYNNYLIYLRAFFNWLVQQEVIKLKNHPLKNEKKKKATRSTQHRPYTNEQLRAILALCDHAERHQLKLYLQFLYYTFARPRSEVRLLRVEDLRQTTIWIRPDQDKNRVGRHVDIPPALEQLIACHQLRTYPGHYYVFGSEGTPGPEPIGITTFSNQFKIVLIALGLHGQSYDLYGFKHTGNINLYLATKDLKAVMDQNGHSSLSMTEKYLRDLGLLQNEKVMNNFPVMGGI